MEKFVEIHTTGDGRNVQKYSEHNEQEAVEALLIICILKLQQEIVG